MSIRTLEAWNQKVNPEDGSVVEGDSTKHYPTRFEFVGNKESHDEN